MVERPTLVFLPRPQAHRLVSDERDGADVVCATVLLGGGALAGLSDAKLSKVLEAIHRQPAFNWDLPVMAGAAGMSRARFADHFREVVGKTPAHYLASWRVMLAQRLLSRGLPAKTVALDVGYSSSSALHRAFVRLLGVSPSGWLCEQSDPR